MEDRHMTIRPTAELSTATATTPAEETREELSDVVTPDELGENVQSDDAIDYKAEAERLKEQLAKAQFTLKKQNMQRKLDREITQSPDLESPDMKAIIEEEVNAGLSALRKSEARDLIDEMIDMAAETTDEAELIKLHYENSIVKTGFTRSALREDIQKAKLLANAPRYLKQKKEIVKSLQAKASMGSGAAKGANQDRPQTQDDLRKRFTARDWEYMQKYKFTPEMIRKAARPLDEATLYT